VYCSAMAMYGGPELTPEPGFVVSVKIGGAATGKLYVNFCTHELVKLPLAPSGAVVTKDHILSRGLGNLQVPLDAGTWRKLKERSEGARTNAFCVDIIFAPFILSLFMDDPFCTSVETFRPYILNVAFTQLERSLGIVINRQTVKQLKEWRYKDGTGRSGQGPRAYKDLPGTPEEPAPAPKQEEPPTLIEEVGVRKKPALKKGFLNKEHKPLYPKGSTEGVLPENAGDPLGYLPKNLRNTCKIIDTNNPKYKQADKVQSENSEFKKELEKSAEAWTNAYGKGHWEEDSVMDVEAEPQKKYSVDYSRFSKIKEEEESKPHPLSGDPGRDYYIDDKGNMVKIAPESAPSTSASTPSDPVDELSGLRKGFLQAAKSELYKEPSRSAPDVPADPLADEASFNEFMKRAKDAGLGEEEGMSNEDMYKGLRGLLDANSRGPPPKSWEIEAERAALAEQAKRAEPAAAARAAREADLLARTAGGPPATTMETTDTGRLLTVSVPHLASMQGVDLDVEKTALVLKFPGGCKHGTLTLDLETPVKPNKVSAKFSKKAKVIKITLPSA